MMFSGKLYGKLGHIFFQKKKWASNIQNKSTSLFKLRFALKKINDV